MKIGITSFDFEAAFKTLDSLDTPVAQKAEKKPLEERLKITDGADMLLEDYYNLSSQRDFEAAQERRELDIALAKLARIEKIVDLDAKSPDEIQPSYVGKIIIQCPQCMTLFYKDLEDITVSEEDPTVVNVGEICQHCGNDSGYTQIGKVGGVEDETTEAEAEEVAEDEVATEAEVEEPVEDVSEEESVEVTDETTAEEALPSIDEIAEDTAEEEEVTESLADIKEALNEAVDFEIGGHKVADVVDMLRKAGCTDITCEERVSGSEGEGYYDDMVFSAEIKDIYKLDKRIPKTVSLELRASDWNDLYAGLIFDNNDVELNEFNNLQELIKTIISTAQNEDLTEDKLTDTITEGVIDDLDKVLDSPEFNLDMQEALTANELGGLDIFKEYNLSGRDLAKIVAALKADLSKEDWKALDEAEVKDFVEMSGGIVPFILTYLITDNDKTTISREGLEVIIKSDDKAMQAVREFADKYKFFWDEEGNPPTVEISDELYFDTVFDLSLTEDWPTTAEELVDIYMGIQPLTEAVDIDDQMDAYNDYIKYLQVMIEQEEEALENAKNDLVKEAIKRRLDAFKLELENALPDAVTSEITVVDLPTPEAAEEADDADPVEDEATEAEEVEEVEEVKVESLTESKEDCEEYEIASIEYDTDDFKYSDDSVMAGKVTVVCVCGEEEFENDIEFTINSGEPTSLELIDAEEEFDEVELATVKALILDSFREEGILLVADEKEREPLTEAPSIARKGWANLKSFLKGGDPRAKIDSVFEKYKIYPYLHIFIDNTAFDLNLLDNKEEIDKKVKAIIAGSSLEASQKDEYWQKWDLVSKSLISMAENEVFTKFTKAEEAAEVLKQNTSGKDKLPAGFSVIIDIVGGPKQASNDDVPKASESFNLKAANAVRLMEAGNSTTPANYVLISRIASNSNTDVVGGLNRILSQQGGKFGSYTPTKSSENADIEAFAKTNGVTASSTQVDSTNTNTTSTTDTDTTSNTPTTSAKKVTITSEDALKAAISISLTTGSIVAVAGAFTYTSKKNSGLDEVLKGITELQRAAGSTPIEIKPIANRKRQDSIGTITSGVFKITKEQANRIITLFGSSLTKDNKYTIENKEFSGAALLRALKSFK